MTDLGLDYSAGRPSGGNVRDAGYGFVMRYLWFPGQQHAFITPQDLASLLAAGVHVGLIFESTANRAAQGFAAGEADAHTAQEQCNVLGKPDAVVYGTVDFDASQAQLPAVADYFNGMISVLGKERVGAYGGYYTLNYLLSVVAYFWQTVAWSGGTIGRYPRLRLAEANILQILGEVSVAGVSCDVNERYSYAGLIGEEGGSGVSSRDLYDTTGVGGITEGRNLFDALNAFEGGVADRFNKQDEKNAQVQATLQGIIQQLNNLRTGGTEGSPVVDAAIDYDLLASKVADKLAARLAD